ncbi:MAG: EF-hand domain-containing protein [Bacillota bacterium]
MFNRYMIIAAAVAAIPAAPALAAAAPAPAKAPAATAKQTTTRAEFVAGVQSRFNAVDANHDGVLDANEVNAMLQKEVQQAQAVQQQQLAAEFAKLDTNKDGQLSKAEFMAAARPLQARQTPQQIIAAIDSNKDGKISFQEYEAGPLSSFNKVDANHDGTITAQELQAARAPKK